MGAGDRMIRLEWAQLEGRRPHALGRNARLPAHGTVVKVPVCRVTTENGLVGVGLSRAATSRRGTRHSGDPLPSSSLRGEL